MPYVNIRVAGTLSKEQKEEICSGVTDVIAKAANKPKESILIFIDEDHITLTVVDVLPVGRLA